MSDDWSPNFGTLDAAAPEWAAKRPVRIAVLGDFSAGAAAGRLDTGAELARRKMIPVEFDNLEDTLARLDVTSRTLIALVEVGRVPPAYAAIPAYICGAVTSYTLNLRFVFTGTSQSSRSTFAKFILVNLIGLGLNTLLLGLFLVHHWVWKKPGVSVHSAGEGRISWWLLYAHLSGGWEQTDYLLGEPLQRSNGEHPGGGGGVLPFQYSLHLAVSDLQDGRGFWCGSSPGGSDHRHVRWGECGIGPIGSSQ